MIRIEYTQRLLVEFVLLGNVLYVISHLFKLRNKELERSKNAAIFRLKSLKINIIIMDFGVYAILLVLVLSSCVLCQVYI